MSFYQELVYALNLGINNDDVVVDPGTFVYGVNTFVTRRSSVPKSGDTPTLQIIVTGGTAPDFTQNKNNPAYDHPGAQLIARARKPSLAEAFARAAYEVLTGVRNQFVNETWYLSIHALQEPFELGNTDPNNNTAFVFNVVADKRPSVGSVDFPSTGEGIVGAYLFEFLGGNENAFVAPLVDDTYPVGVTYDKLVPGSSSINPPGIPTSGSLKLEASARCDVTGGRVKIALFNLDTDTMVANSEIEFSDDSIVGERARSTSMTIAAGTNYGVKMTTNHAAVRSAVWNAHIVHI